MIFKLYLIYYLSKYLVLPAGMAEHIQTGADQVLGQNHVISNIYEY
jgi:hypothetical protein